MTIEITSEMAGKIKDLASHEMRGGHYEVPTKVLHEILGVNNIGTIALYTQLPKQVRAGFFVRSDDITQQTISFRTSTINHLAKGYSLDTLPKKSGRSAA